MSKLKEVQGDYASSSEDAIESASSAALAFLKDASMIYADDANSSELRACEKKLLAANSWAMLFESRANDLEDKLCKMTNNTSKENNSKDMLRAFSVPEHDANQHTPPPLQNLGTSKCPRTQSTCNARKGLFLKCHSDQAGEEAFD